MSTRSQTLIAPRRTVRDHLARRAEAPVASEPDAVEPAPAAPKADERASGLRIVPRAKRRRRAGLVAALVCVVVFTVMFGLAAFQAKIAADQLRLDKLDKATATAQATYGRLRLQVSQLNSPENVVAAAKQAGMVVPTTIVYVSPSVADVEAIDQAAGRSSQPGPSQTPPSGDDWSALKPIVSGAP